MAMTLTLTKSVSNGGRPKPVTAKSDFVQRYYRNHFGNRAPTWNNLEDYLEDHYLGLVHLRNRVKGGPTFYNVPAEKIVELWNEQAAYNPTSWYISAMAPHEYTVLQGELGLFPEGLTLLYSTLKMPMRPALLAGSQTTQGIIANCLLQTVMDPSSYDWIQELLDLYPDHYIEFSTFRVNWGTIPNRNTVIWEVRSY